MKFTRTFGFLKCALGATVLLAGASHAAYGATATVSSSSQQTVAGWGCFPGFNDSTLTNGTSVHNIIGRPPAILDAIYNMGFDIMRVEISPNLLNADGTVNATSLSDLKTDLRQGRQRGVTKWVTSVWVAPAQFTLTDAATGKKILNPNKINDFVNFYVARIQDCMGDGNAAPLAVSVQNEPSYSPMVYTLNDSTKATFRAVTKALRSALNNAHLGSVQLLAPEGGDTSDFVTLLGDFQGTNGSGGYAWMESDQALRDAIGGLTTHTYSYGDIDKHVNAWNHYGKPLWMTEWSPGKNQPDTTTPYLNEMRHLGADMIDLRQNYWFWWTGFQQRSDGTLEGQAQVWADYNETQPHYVKSYWIFKKLWNTVRPGWKVKRVSSDDPDLKGSNDGNLSGTPGLQVETYAFESPDASSSVVVMVNPTTSAKTFSVGGLQGATVTQFQTTPGVDMSSNMSDKGTLEVSGGVANGVTLAPQSVTLLSSGGGSGSTGSASWERWNNASGSNVSDVPLSVAPSQTGYVTSLETPDNNGTFYGERIRGYIQAPVSGNYFFWIAGDDACEFDLSSDSNPSNKSRLAYVPDYTGKYDWNHEANQKSVSVALVAGTKYYFEVLHKQGDGGANLAVGWARPDKYTASNLPTMPVEIVPGAVLSPFVVTSGGSVPLGQRISLKAKANSQYVCADNGGASALIANRTSVGSWEQFDVVDAGSGQIALKAFANGNYVSTANTGASPLVAGAGAIGSWEKFNWIANSDGTISLKAASNGQYVCADNSGASPLIANRSGIGDWEKFNWSGTGAAASIRTASLAPSSSPASVGTGTGVKGQYYADAGFSTLVQTRRDAQINFDWGKSGAMTSVGPNRFGVRWTGQVQAREGGTYVFSTQQSGHVRLWINGQLLINTGTTSASSSNPSQGSGTVHLEAGTRATLSMEFTQSGSKGSSRAKLFWQRPSQDILATRATKSALSGALMARAQL